MGFWGGRGIKEVLEIMEFMVLVGAREIVGLMEIGGVVVFVESWDSRRCVPGGNGALAWGN